MIILEAIKGIKQYLSRNEYSKSSQDKIYRYCRNQLTGDIFRELPFKNIFDYQGPLTFLTMGNYLVHFPQEFKWDKYVKNLPLNVLEQKVVRKLWENSPGGSPLHCFLLYLQKEGLISTPLILKAKPKWKKEVEKLLQNLTESPKTLKEGLGFYLSYLIDYNNITDRGLQSKYAQLKAIINWLNENRNIIYLKEITLELVQEFLDYRQYERGNNPTTIYHAVSAIKGMFQFLCDREYLKENPLASLIAKRNHTKLPENVPSPKEMEKLLQVVYQEAENCKEKSHYKLFLTTRNWAILQLICTTGIRLTELCQLTLNQIDYYQGYIKVKGKGNSSYAKKERKLFLEEGQTVDALSEYLKLRICKHTDILFLSNRGLSLRTTDVYKVVKKYVVKAGLNKKYSPHKLRAGFASMLIIKGIDPLTLKEIMGHKSLTTTLNCYTRLEQEELRKVWKKCNPLTALHKLGDGQSD